MRQTESFEPVRDQEKKIIKEKSESVYVTCAGGVPIQPVAMEVCTHVKDTRLIKHANFDGLI